jgi:hypothetical protein
VLVPFEVQISNRLRTPAVGMSRVTTSAAAGWTSFASVGFTLTAYGLQFRLRRNERASDQGLLAEIHCAISSITAEATLPALR